MLQDRSFTGTDVEHEAVNALLAEHDPDGDHNPSVTRSEPDETGPLRVEINGETWLVADDGETTKEDVIR